LVDGKYFFFASTRGRKPTQQQLSYAELLAARAMG
jgi:hypothetical protein